LILALKSFSLREWSFIPKYSKTLYPASASCTDFIERIYYYRLSKFYRTYSPYEDIKENLALDKIPHFTILQKFVTRFHVSLFNLLRSRILKLFYSYGENVSVAAIDATEFTSHKQVIILPEERRSFFEASWELQYR